MKRRAFTVVAASLTVLCAGACGLWVRSYRIEDGLYVAYGWRYARFAAYRGEIGCEFGRWYDGGPQDMYSPRPHVGYGRQLVRGVPASDYVHIAEAEGRFGNMAHYRDVWGFRWHPRSDLNWEYRERGIAVPAWSVMLLTGVIPAWLAAAWFRRFRRRSKGLCTRCGYDLRATPARCPECGAAPAARAGPP